MLGSIPFIKPMISIIAQHSCIMFDFSKLCAVENSISGIFYLISLFSFLFLPPSLLCLPPSFLSSYLIFLRQEASLIIWFLQSFLTYFSNNGFNSVTKIKCSVRKTLLNSLKKCAPVYHFPWS